MNKFESIAWALFVFGIILFVEFTDLIVEVVGGWFGYVAL